MISKAYIHIKTYPRLDAKEYSGICTVENESMLMLLNFNDETGLFDGFTIFRNDDIEFYCEWDEEDFNQLKNDNSNELMSGLDLSGFLDFPSSLEQLRKKLIAVYTDDDFESYYVGKIGSINNNTLSFLLISEEAEWLEVIELDLEAIWYIGFGTEYEKQLMKKA